MVSVAGIVLAAGLSTRMGTPKLLLELDNESIIYRVVRSAVLSQLDEVILVTGKVHSQILQTLHELSCHPKLRISHNKNPGAGMASSIVTGMLSISKERHGIMIILGDQVKLTTDVIDHLVSAFSQLSNTIIAPTVGGRRTTPVVFPAYFFRALMSLSGDRGGRSILDANPGAVVTVEVGDSYDDIDIDTEKDFKKVRDLGISQKDTLVFPHEL